MSQHRIFATPFAKLYPMYVNKAERKGRSKAEVDQIICWLSGHDQQGLDALLQSEASVEDFVTQAPALNPHRELIKGVVCGVRVEEVEDSLMRELRYLDKLIDELARGKAVEKILRQP